MGSTVRAPEVSRSERVRKVRNEIRQHQILNWSDPRFTLASLDTLAGVLEEIIGERESS